MSRHYIDNQIKIFWEKYGIVNHVMSEVGDVRVYLGRQKVFSEQHGDQHEGESNI